MKILVTSVMLFWTVAWAQEGRFREFQRGLAYGLRVAEMPCPEKVAPKFPEAIRYLHDYSDFFDFKEAVAPYTLDFVMELEPWRVVTMTFGTETVETFRVRYQLRETLEPITLTYVSENLLVLESDVRASP